MKNLWVNECLNLYFNGKHTNAVELLLSNLPHRLYKYRPLSQHAIDNIRNDNFRLSDAGYLNDPYEFWPTADYQHEAYLTIKERRQLFADAGLNFTDEEFTNIENDINPYGKMKAILGERGEAHLLYESKFKTAYFKLLEKMLDAIQKGFFIQSFSENNSSTIMWSHYADRHKGICIEYDFKSYHFKLPLFPVSYSHERYIIKDFERKSPEEINKALYLISLQKAMGWAYEEEWRLITFLVGIENQHAFTPAPKITAIYLGSMFNKNNYPLTKQFQKLAEVKAIPLYEMKLHEKEFKMVAK